MRESEQHGRIYRAIERMFDALVRAYARGLDLVLRHRFVTLMTFFATIALTAVLFVAIPKGFFPTQDTGLISGIMEAAQDVSPQEMKRLQREVATVLSNDPDIAGFGTFFGSGSGNTLNTARFFIGLKPHEERSASATQIIARLRPQIAKLEGVALFLQPAQDITVGGRISRGQYQYTLQDPSLGELNTWAPKMLEKFKTLPELADVSTDQQSNAPLLSISINRDAAARFGIQPQVIDDTLNDAFGQRQVAQYFTQTNSYFVVLEVLPGMQTGRSHPGAHLSEGGRRQPGAALHAGQHRHRQDRRALGLAPEPVPGGHAVVQPAAGRRARAGGRRDPRGRDADRQAGLR